MSESSELPVESHDHLADDAHRAIRDHIAPRVERYTDIRNRMRALLEAHGTLQRAGSQHADEVLRAIVVLLHATIEDQLRNVAASHLPLSGEAALNDIPLVGLNASGRPEKFYLGKLYQYREKTVAQILSESVETHLRHSTYNSIADVAALLKTIGFEMARWQTVFPGLERLMMRRHQIVHRADRVDDPVTGKPMLQSIELSEVEEWVTLSETFIFELLWGLAVVDSRAGRLPFKLQHKGTNPRS